MKDAELRQSMSRLGNCWDNAPQESFFGHIKDEIYISGCERFQQGKDIMEDIFQSHMAMIRNGTFQPVAWVKGRLSGERSCPQACAVYLLDLLILRVLFQRQCRIKIEDWGFISQFVRLNAPPPKKRDAAEGGLELQENLLPSEEIILRFMALFQLRRKDNTILIEKRNQAKEVEQIGRAHV